MKKVTFAFLFFIGLYCNSFAQQTPKTYTLKQLQARFKHANYTEKVLLDFQKTMENLREKPQLNEDIPGEVISWNTFNGQFSWHRTYLVEKDKVKEVPTIPKDEKFLKKLNSYVPEASKFSYSSDLWSFAFVEKKLEDNFYLIQATTKSFNSYPEMPNDDILIYDIEYKTKDFKEFFLVRLKDTHTEKWTEVIE
ncbi:MAG: hypothetical protein V4666_13240 [Bacteroidota bacterium]